VIPTFSLLPSKQPESSRFPEEQALFQRHRETGKDRENDRKILARLREEERNTELTKEVMYDNSKIMEEWEIT
jgi:hypothetical protein